MHIRLVRGSHRSIAFMLVALAGVALAQVQPKLYVSNLLDHTVSVIDPSTNSLLRTIPIPQYSDGAASPWGVAYASDTNEVFVTSLNSVAVIDPARDVVVGQLPSPGSPLRLLLSNDKQTLFITTFGGVVGSLDRASRAITNSVQLGAFPEGIASSRDGSKLFVSTDSDSMLTVLDARTLAILTQIPMPQFPRGVTVSPDGAKVYVASESGVVSILDANTNQTLTTLTVPLNADEIAFASDGSFAYVAAGDQFVTIDPSNTSVSRVTKLPFFVQSLVLGGGQQAYMMGSYDRKVVVVDLLSLHSYAFIPAGYGAWYGAFSGTPPASMSIMVKPGKNNNNIIQSTAGGSLAVAVLGSLGFNPNAVLDVLSLRFGATGSESSLVSCSRDGEDVNKDGFLDMVCHFDIQSTGLHPGASQALLTAKTIAGDPVSAVAAVLVQ